MDEKQTKLQIHELASVLKSLFPVTEEIGPETDLSLYIKDSIDLGELLAVVKERYGVVVVDTQLFKTHSRFSDVLKIFNNEL